MIGELDAQVGHLFVVGGRAVSAKPPGALIMTSPARAARGREGDTFYTLVTPAGAEQAQAAFYEQLAHMAADHYFATTGGVTNALRESITGANEHLLSGAGSRYQATIVCMVLRGREAFTARVGPCLTLLKAGETLSSAPDDLRDEYALNGLPLGYSPSPDIKLGHYDVGLGQVLVLSDTGLAAIGRDQLAAALGGDTLNVMVDALKPLAAPRTQAMLIHFALAPVPAPSIAVPIPIPLPINAAAPAAPKLPTLIRTEPRPSTPPPSPGIARESPIPRLIGNIRHALYLITRPFVVAFVFILTSIARVLNGILDRLLPEPEDGSPHIPATVAAGAAIMIPVLIVFVMVGLRLSQVDETNFEKLVAQVQDQANQAAAVPTTNIDRAKTLWQAVIQRVDEADKLHPGDPVLAQIRAKAQGILDSFASVTRRPATPLRSFNASVRLGAVFVQGGTDVYTLDMAGSAIYRDTLQQPALIGTRGTQPIVQSGSAVSAFSVKHIVSMIWMNEGGIRNSHALVALDTQGILVSYSPTFAPAIAQQLQGTDQWVKPVAVRSWQDRLYVLDPGANQIWRYLPSGTTYPNAPEEYFGSAYQRQLSSAVDFAIDDKGNVYILFADGTLKQYNAGAEQAFTLNGLPDGKLKSANAMYLDTISPLPAIFVTDPVDQSIYEFTLAGVFQARFRASDPNAFSKLSGVFVNGSSLYVTAGQVLYYLNTGEVTAPATPAR